MFGEDQIGKYKLLKRLAIGGMAEIYLAQEIGIAGFQRLVVIKKILPNLLDFKDFITMFLDEARLAARLSHPNIIHIYELEQKEDDGLYYIVMEYIIGGDLFTLLKKRDNVLLPLDETICIITQILSGLHYAHELTDQYKRPLNIVHRDVNPKNVLISENGVVKLVDFGIAKARTRITSTRPGDIKGTFSYMAPEQARGKAVDRRTDIYATGSILYWLVTGQKAYPQNKDLLLEAVQIGNFIEPRKINPNVPEEIERIILKAMSEDPDNRYNTATEMRRELIDISKYLKVELDAEKLSNTIKKNFPEDLIHINEESVLFDKSYAPPDEDTGLVLDFNQKSPKKLKESDRTENVKENNLFIYENINESLLADDDDLYAKTIHESIDEKDDELYAKTIHESIDEKVNSFGNEQTEQNPKEDSYSNYVEETDKLANPINTKSTQVEDKTELLNGSEDKSIKVQPVSDKFNIPTLIQTESELKSIEDKNRNTVQIRGIKKKKKKKNNNISIFILFSFSILVTVFGIWLIFSTLKENSNRFSQNSQNDLIIADNFGDKEDTNFPIDIVNNYNNIDKMLKIDDSGLDVFNLDGGFGDIMQYEDVMGFIDVESNNKINENEVLFNTINTKNKSGDNEEHHSHHHREKKTEEKVIENNINEKNKTFEENNPNLLNEQDTGPAHLSVLTVPYSEVYLDDKLLGTTPMAKRLIQPGKHTLKLVNPEKTPKIIEIEIMPGQDLRIRENL